MIKNTIFIYALLIVQFGVSQNNPLIIPPTIETTNINLNLQNSTHQFLPGQITATMGANGSILGPTLIVNQGDNLDINVTNNLGQTTTIHWHGMHVSAANDGGPHTTIAPGATWNPQFTVLDKAATYWYHPHLHEFTDEHVSKGIAGLIIVKDTEEAALNLPRTYGVDDIPLVVQTKDFDANNQIVNHSNADDVLLVNATINPETDVPAQVVRFRLLNGSSQRVFNFGFSGNKTFYQIATDGGLKSAPAALTRLQLAPGERSEILVDLQGMQGQTLQLMSYASEFGNGIYGATAPGMNGGMPLDNYNPNPMNGADFNVLQLNIVAQTSTPVTTIPSALVTVTPYLEANADQTRNLQFNPVAGGFNQLNGDFIINGVSMDMNTINITIPLNNTEIWSIQNGSAISHPLHIHDIQYYILDINGNPPPPAAQGWKDTYLVPAGQGTMRVITKFTDFADDTVPYMYHCHMLTHEDGGMMGQFVVTDLLGVDDNELINTANGFTLYPNPSQGTYITAALNDKTDKIRGYAIINTLGQIVNYHKIHENEWSNMYSFPVFEYSTGTYFVRIFTAKTIYKKKFNIN